MMARTFHYLWLLSVGALLVVAIVLAAGRLWVPILGDYRTELEALATDVLHKTVTIGRIEGTWRGLNPVFKLQDVAITEPGRAVAALAIDEIWIGIDVKNSLHDQRLLLESIDLIGVVVTVIRDPDGNFHIDRMTHDPG